MITCYGDSVIAQYKTYKLNNATNQYIGTEKTNDLATVGTRDAVIDYGKVFSIVEFNTKKLYKY
jgi:hypothetical protein